MMCMNTGNHPLHSDSVQTELQLLTFENLIQVSKKKKKKKKW